MNTLIIKNFLNKLEINKLTPILFLLSFITGLFKEIIALYLLIIFHEFGHYIASYYYSWNINKIVIYPFGGLIKYNDIIDKPFYQELIVTLSGPINQLVIFFIMSLLYKKYIISHYFYNALLNYNYALIVFNILPIIPLDGSKIMNIVLNKVFSYKKSYYLLSIISIYTTIFFIFYIDSYSYILVISYLIMELYNYINYGKYMINRFILEKILFKNNYKKIIKKDSIYHMKRNKRHLIKIHNKYYDEKEAIKKIKGV